MFHRSVLMVISLIVVRAQDRVCLKSPTVFNVASAKEAATMARAAGCPDTSVSAIWQGRVQPPRTIVVGESSSLTLTGSNAEAIIDGGGKTQLFVVFGNLTLVSVTLTGGFTGDENGGAISIKSYGRLAASGTIFKDNAVTDQATPSNYSDSTAEFVDTTQVGKGGAVYGDINSTISIGSSLFINNTASMRGGGIWTAGVLNITNSTFTSNAACVGNKVGCQGAGAIGSLSSVVISDSIFEYNSAVDNNKYEFDTSIYGRGGAIDCSSNLPTGRITPDVYIERSLFKDNVANVDGGAILLNGNLTLNKCEFSSNEAAYRGGAVMLTGGLIAIKQCTFNDNTATDGGTISESLGGALYLSRNAAAGVGRTGTVGNNFTIDSSTFSNNSCAASGGAVHSEVSKLNITNTSFASNKAFSLTGSGGAVFLKGSLTYISNSTFTANQANLGGAVAAAADCDLHLSEVVLTGNVAASGGAMNVLSFLGCSNCTFSGNSAQSQGGAIVGGSSSDLRMANSTCTHNTCRGNGGCFHTTGSLHCDNCTVSGNEAAFNGGALYTDFGAIITLNTSLISENAAQQSGGGWFGFGSDKQALTVNSTTFIHNTASCCYAAGYGSKLQSVGTSITGTTCSDTDTGSSLASQRLKPGFWRASLSTTDIRDCWYAEACNATANATAVTTRRATGTATTDIVQADDNRYCTTGYKGPWYQCTQCRTGTKAAIYSALALVLVAFALATWYLAIQLLGLSDGQDAISTFSALGCMKKLASLPWDKLRIPVVAFQIVTQFISITGLPLPDIYRNFLSWTDAFNLNLGWLLSLGCLTKIDFYQKLLITTLGPVVVAAALTCTHTVVRYRNPVQAVAADSQIATQPATPSSLEKALAKHYLVFLAMTFLIYSTVSTTVFQTFACDIIDEDIKTAVTTRYLRADYSIQCDTHEHNLYKAYAAIMIIIYPLGIPALYAWLLWSNKGKLSSKNDASVRMLNRHRDVSLRPTRFLWKTYTPQMYYWEVVECMRRQLLTGTIVFIKPGTRAQVSVACILAVVSMVTALHFRPHADTLDGRIYTVGAMIIFLSMFLSLAMKTDNNNETKDSQNAFAVVLVVLNVVMMGTAVVQIIQVGRRAQHPKQNSVLGLRNTDNDSDRGDVEEPTEVATDATIDATSVMPPRPTLRFRHSGDSKQTDVAYDSRVKNEQQQQPEVRF
eukprot:18362-Heterococcus_DN1.PRE.1